jgi:hypothetical protein
LAFCFNDMLATKTVASSFPFWESSSVPAPVPSGPCPLDPFWESSSVPAPVPWGPCHLHAPTLHSQGSPITGEKQHESAVVFCYSCSCKTPWARHLETQGCFQPWRLNPSSKAEADSVSGVAPPSHVAVLLLCPVWRRGSGLRFFHKDTAVL